MITYQLDMIPFSYPGSFLTITSRNSSGSPRLLYRTSSGRVYNRSLPYTASDFFEIALTRAGSEMPYTWTAQPHRLDLHAGDSSLATIAFADPQTLVFETQGVDLRLMPCKPFPLEYRPDPGQVCLMDWVARGVHEFRVCAGTRLTASITPTVTGLESHAQEFPRTIDFLRETGIVGCKGTLRFSRFEERWTDPFPEVSEILKAREKEGRQWMKRLPEVPEDYNAAAELAWFLLWNSQAPAEGALTRPAVYMSKFWMNAIWAWDNCFNALALASADPELAWDQLLLFFDHQEPHGMLPDMINDLEPVYGYNKPPIYGWTIRKLVDLIGMKKSLPYLQELYKPLRGLTEWWYTLRDYGGDGMCQYHHGNDSGWDNATAFDQGYPTEGADLSAYLVLQCEGLSFMAEALGHKKGATRWQEAAGHQLQVLITNSVKDDRFFSPLDGRTEAPETLSLLNYIPIILGHRLPKRLRKALVADLGPNGAFLTPFGLASEAPASPKYQSDGYWRGPIWAPSTYLIFNGLMNAGETDLARTIAEKFCYMCQREPGFWENYDALTGKGLRCPGYSWTASVFLLLANWLAQQQKKR